MTTLSDGNARHGCKAKQCSVGVAVLAFVFFGTACGRRAPYAADWTPRVERIESPVGPASAQPQLTTSAGGVVLSWLENAGSQTRFTFAERTARGWSEPRLITSGDDLFENWADLPSVVRLRDGHGTLVAHWLRRSAAGASGYDVELATSADDGRTWSRAFSPHRDGTKTQHGFASIFALPGGTTPFGLVWLDGRATTPAANPDDDATGEMTLRSARYDAAWQQQADDAIDLRVCDCCPTASAATADGVVVAYRDRSADEVRDIYVTRLVGGKWTEPAPVHKDGWRIDGCPVNGPALSARGRDVAVAWFSAPNDQGHAFVAFSRDSGGAFGAPIRVDDAGALGRVSVELLSDGSAIVSWIELADRRATFMTRRIAPGGERSPSVTVAEITARRSSNYPRMAQGDHEIVFAWIGGDHSSVQTAIARLP
jgi:hypothetical protein